LKKLIELVDHVTDRTTEMNPRFIKQGQLAVARFALLASERAICMELFERHRELGRFTLCSEGRIVAVGNVLEVIQ
jgi:translation elongation factor EF-1alpha